MSARALRVALLTSSRNWRGSGFSYARIAHGVAERGGHAQIFSAHRAVTERAAALGVPVTELPRTAHTGARAVRELRRALADHAIDALVVDKRRDLVHGALAVAGRPVALASRYNYPRWAVPRDPVARLAYRRIDVTIFLTESGLAHARRAAPFMLRRPFFVVPEGIDAGRFRPDAAAGAAFRRRHGFGDAPLVVGVGALEAEKRYHVLLDALALLAPAAPALYLAGTGGEREPLAAQAARLGLDVRFGGAVPVEELAAAYAAATVFAHPSTMETFGLAVGEAMASGCAVVAADAGSLPEVVDDGGVLVPPDDPAALAGAIGTLIADPARRAALGRRARARVLERYTPAQMEEGHFAALARAAALRGR